MIKTCKQCNLEFKTRKSKKLFCSRRCYMDWRVATGVVAGDNNPTKNPAVAKKISESKIAAFKNPEFHAMMKAAHNTPEYKKEASRRMSGKLNPMYREEAHSIRVCPTCNKEFEVDWKNRKNKFCSIECLTSNPAIIEKQNAARKLKYETDPEYREHCKRSEECRKLIGDANRGELSANWQGGISDYPYTPEFNRMLKDKIRARDNNTCQLCGKEWEPGTRAFHIHHIDYNKVNCDPKNLITLCLGCHAKTNHDRDLWPGVFEAQSTLNQNQWSLEVIPQSASI